MPSGPKRLRDKFMKFDENTGITSDGIVDCFDIIEKFGGQIMKGGIILLPVGDNYPDDISDAVNYLCLEWDYDYDYASNRVR